MSAIDYDTKVIYKKGNFTKGISRRKLCLRSYLQVNQKEWHFSCPGRLSAWLSLMIVEPKIFSLPLSQCVSTLHRLDSSNVISKH